MSTLTIDNRSLIHRVYDEMWNRADPAAAHRIFARPEGVERFMKEFLAAFPDLQHAVEEIILEGDRVAVRFSARGTHTGTWREFAPSRRPIHYSGVTLAHIADNRIVDHHTWWDALELRQQIRGTENRPESY